MSEHKWVVYSTATADVCLLLQCERCHSLGVVEDPSNEEWHEGFWAPSQPYEWRGGDDRVKVVRRGPVSEGKCEPAAELPPCVDALALL